MTNTSFKFSAKVQKIKSNIQGTFNSCVIVPDKVVFKLLDQAKKKSVPVQVKGTLNGKKILANIVKYHGAYQLYLNTQMRQNTGITVGDVVRVSLSYDSVRRELPIPKELKIVLSKNGQAYTVWQKLPPSHRKEFLSYLNSIKTKESLKRNVKKIIQILIRKT
jgi:hypothetical protein